MEAERTRILKVKELIIGVKAKPRISVIKDV
jgi:hypothetical protein